MSNFDKQPNKHNKIKLDKIRLPKPKEDDITQSPHKYNKDKDKVLKQILKQNPKIKKRSAINIALNHLKNEIILNLKNDLLKNPEKIKNFLHFPLLIKNINEKKVKRILRQITKKLNDLYLGKIKIYCSESCVSPHSRPKRSLIVINKNYIEQQTPDLIVINKNDIERQIPTLIYSIGHEIGHILFSSSPIYGDFFFPSIELQHKNDQFEELVCDCIGILCVTYFLDKDTFSIMHVKEKSMPLSKYQFKHPNSKIRNSMINNFLRNKNLGLGNHNLHFNKLKNKLREILKNDIDERASYKEKNNIYKNFEIALKNISESEKALENLYEISIKNYYLNLDNRIMVSKENLQKCLDLLQLATEKNFNIKFFIELFEEDSQIQLLNRLIFLHNHQELLPLFDKLVGQNK